MQMNDANTGNAKCEMRGMTNDTTNDNERSCERKCRAVRVSNKIPPSPVEV